MTEPLKPCRSPYCECTENKCTHPGCYDVRSEPWPQSTEEQHVRTVLATLGGLGFVTQDDALDGAECIGSEYTNWHPSKDYVSLDGDFTAMQLAALAWWMLHKAAPKEPV